MRASLCAALLVATFSCDKVDYIEIDPSEVEFLARTESRVLSGRCMSRTGYRAERAQVSWKVKDPDIAEISPKGVLKPKKSGASEVLATFGDIEAAIPVRVNFVEKIEVLSPSMNLKEGGETGVIQLKFVGLNGKDLGKRGATYSVKDKSVAAIVGGNAVLPLDPGKTTIDIQVDGVAASLEVTVEGDKAAKKVEGKKK
jgi:hypothetical protein